MKIKSALIFYILYNKLNFSIKFESIFKNTTMKKIMYAIVVCVFLGIGNLFAQDEETVSDSTGLPGDHFSLQGALEMFKKSSSLEDFETKLNEESNYVNNLDLNDDNQTDYVEVSDVMEGNIHAVVLKVAVNEKESQDI